jgi:endonuclease/exonuclease/phosphatase (EEP) superfamily protein YafD
MVRRLVAVCAIAYVLALFGVVAALRLIGERWWLTTAALYLPRLGWALPLPFLTLALLLTRTWWLLLTQLVALLVVLFPLMGLHLSSPRAATPGAFHFRILTLNIGDGQDGIDSVVARVRDANPDVIVLVEVAHGNALPLQAGLPGFTFQHLDQFVIASRFPIEDPFVPPEIEVDGRLHTRHYVRCRLLTPSGPIRLYATHPLSPHRALDRVRGEGLRNEILSGRAFQDHAQESVAENTRQRVAHVRTLAEDAASSPDPVLIAGDTNLPGLSWALGHWLGGYQDAFAEVGRGFGYTYPAHKWAWMRIDRILGGPQLRFLSARTVAPRVHKHLGLVAEVELPSPGQR